MLSDSDPRAKLHAALAEESDVFTGHISDPAKYIANARERLIESECEPYFVSALVMPPAFPDHAEGETIGGYCVAKREGYWLVYSPEEDRFYCFWGTHERSLGAHGIYGSPLSCWLA
jgi:hypothetical protein